MAEQSEDDRKLEIIASLASIYNRQFTPGAIKLMLSALKDYPADCVEKAAEKLTIESKFMPTIAQLTDVAMEFMQLIPLKSQGEWTQEQFREFLEKSEAVDED